jgi:hypothetical protein
MAMPSFIYERDNWSFTTPPSFITITILYGLTFDQHIGPVYGSLAGAINEQPIGE